MKYTVTYDKVKFSSRKSGACPVCELHVQRSRTFWATLSPFNKDEQGNVRTELEILACLRKEAEAWEPDFTHEKCST